ncbi:PEP-CTERM sorting domain-containing protein [Bythopirellula goksoeyrii]|nr:PEP-CTERM sorting domain-containing protein [Bythopirellula goksoeyrii]
MTLSSVVAVMSIGITEAVDQLIRHSAINTATVTSLGPNTGSGNPVAIVIVPGSPEVAAMFAGVSDPATAPTLLVETIGVPEPASAAMLMTAGAVACRLQRRSRGAVMDPLIALAFRLSVGSRVPQTG